MKKKKKTKCAVALILCDIIIVIGFFLTYGPISYFRNLLVTTSMTTMTHKYLARTFYTDEMIDEILKSNTVTEIGESVNVNDIVIGDFEQTGTYESVYEEEILKHEEGQDYKIVPLSGSGYKGYMAVIYDPSKIELAVAPKLGVRGSFLKDIAKENQAKVAINASGFLDPNEYGNGGAATGNIIKDGKLNFSAMAKIRYSLDDLILQLREKGYQSIEEVSFAILENNGSLSVFEGTHEYPMPLILDGVIDEVVLGEIGKDKGWLMRLLDRKKVRLENVFYAFYTKKKTFIITQDELE